MPDTEETKANKKDVLFTYGNKKEHCGNCYHWLEHYDRCELVLGITRANMCCNLWKRHTSRT